MPVIATGLDYSAARLSGASIRKAGYKFVNRYLWFPGQRWPSLTAAEYHDLRSNGLEVHAIYEQNTNDPAGGWRGGELMARQAVLSAQMAGMPRNSVIFMCADAWLSTHKIPVATAMAFLDGARSVIDPAGYIIGAYGFADFIFAAHKGGHADRFWLCGAEIPEQHRPPWLHMYQWNNGRVYVDGVECDLNKQYIPMWDIDEEEDDMPYTRDQLKEIMREAIFDEVIHIRHDPVDPVPGHDVKLRTIYEFSDLSEIATRQVVEAEADALAEKLEGGAAVDYDVLADKVMARLETRLKPLLDLAKRLES